MGRMVEWEQDRAAVTGGGLSQALDRAPAVQLGDLKKGDAVMLVLTEGTDNVTAIKLLAGVEPLLESPDASRNLLANWMDGFGRLREAAFTIDDLQSAGIE